MENDCRGETHEATDRVSGEQSAVFGGTVHTLGRKAAPAIAEVETLTDEVVVLIEGHTAS